MGKMTAFTAPGVCVPPQLIPIDFACGIAVILLIAVVLSGARGSIRLRIVASALPCRRGSLGLKAPAAGSLANLMCAALAGLLLPL